MKLLGVTFVCISACSFASTAAEMKFQQPPIPVWPDMFSIKYEIFVEQYGPDWKSSGGLYYHWPNQTFRSDYYNWCLPLFDSGPGEFNNYTCSFLATNGSMYFVNHTSPNKVWEENECCLFEAGLASVAPDWMKNTQYNGTVPNLPFTIDIWWFPGTNDPTKPCYGYWNIRDKVNTPVRFFGLSSIGPTILEYHQFKPGMIQSDVDISMPLTGCDKECEPPLVERLRKAKEGPSRATVPSDWPNWPSCA